jgi:hypothetical protein
LATINGDLEAVRYLVVDACVDGKKKNFYAFRWAVRCGYLDILKLLVEEQQCPSFVEDDVIKFAELNGHKDIIEYLNAAL